MMAIGIGAKSTATPTDIIAAIDAARQASRLHADIIATLANAPFETALQAAATEYKTRLITFTPATLASRNADCQTASQLSRERFGVTSIAEASALVAAGENSRLIVPRLVCGPVTAAAAISADHAESSL